MEIVHRKSGDMNIFSLTGSLDIYTAVELKNYFESKIKEGDSKCIINLESVSYVDSSGIGILIKMMNFVKSINGVFYLANMKPPLEKVFKVAGLNSYFQFLGEKDFAEQYSGS